MSDTSDAVPTPKNTPAAPYKAILVPLDGSPLAEKALPTAELMARQFGSTVLLARIIPLISSSTILASEGAVTSPEVYQQLYDDEQRAAQDYLAARAEPLRARGVDVRTLFARGDPASCLLDLMASEHVGLIVMTTHGRSGIARWALGSVADRLVRSCTTPLLLIRSTPAAA